MRNMRIMPGAGETDGVWHLSLITPGPADVNKLLLYRNKNERINHEACYGNK